MSERSEPIDLLEFVGEVGRQYVVAPATDVVDDPAPEIDLRSPRERRADAKARRRAERRAAARAEHLARAGVAVAGPTGADADVADVAGDPDRRYVPSSTGTGQGRQRAWLVCVALLALALPTLVIAYGANRPTEPAEALAAPPTTATTIEDTTSQSLRLTEATEATTTTVEETTTVPPTEAPTTTSSLVTTTVPITAAPTTTVTTMAMAAVAAVPAPTTTAAPTTTTTAAPVAVSPVQGEAAFLACVRQRESGGNYGAVSRDGLYRGAYQFHQATWDGVARSVGRTDLVGVPPNLASPADQDALALALYRSAGAAPWGGYCA